MNDSELTELIRRCPSSIPKERMKGRFYETPGLSCTWYGNIDSNRLEICFPDYLRDAPYMVLIDLTKKIIQRALYDSDSKLSSDSREWLIGGFQTPEKVRTYCERNGFTEFSQYNDAVIVTSNGDVVDSSLFFKVISVPKKMTESPELERIIVTTYNDMFATRERFLEA